MKNRYLPFGYKIADGKIVADSEQVEAVRRIFDAYTAGQTFQQIADALSAQGIPYRSDASRWNKNMVSRILANADYCGTAEYPQIITAGQFEAAEQIRKSKTVTYSATLKPFRKDMHCRCCGARLYWHPKSNQWFCRECGMWSKPTQAEETFNVLTGVHKKNTGQLPQYYIENYHEGIVSKQMFREVQAEIARRNSKSAANQRKRRRGRYNSKYALSERLFCGDCGSPYKRVTWNIHGRKQIVWRCVNRIEYGTKFCGSSPSIPEEELHRVILKAVQDLAANFTDEVAAQINGILHDIQTGESAKPNLQEQLEQTQQEFDRLLEMSLDFDEDTPFLDDRLKKLNSKIKSLKKGIEDSAARQEKIGQPEMLLSAKDMQIQEYDDTLTARIIEKITVRSRNEIEIRFIGGYKKTMQLI